MHLLIPTMSGITFAIAALLPVNTNKATLRPPKPLDREPVILDRVIDGDTVKLSINNESVRIRLACIDAPELKQTRDGHRSKKYLKSLFKPNEPITFYRRTLDYFGRTVGEIYVGSESVNLQMVEAGEAFVYERYLHLCSETQHLYKQAEITARQQKLGVWNSPKIEFPWSFRNRFR